MTDDMKQRLRIEGDGVMSRREKTQIADLIEQLEKERDEATSAVKRLSDGKPFDAVVIADTVKRRTAQLEAERDELKDEIERKMSAGGFILKEVDQLREQVKMLQSAIKNLRDVKGRHHSEIAYKRLIEALAATEPKS